MIRKPYRVALAMLCSAAAMGGLHSSANAAEPIKLYASAAREPGKAAYPAQGAGFSGPCGIAVDPKGSFYVSDYYHEAVQAFDSSLKFLGKPSHEGQGGSCALALDKDGSGIYLNDFHRDVGRFSLLPGPAFGPGTVLDSSHPTGVAVDPETGNVYVNDRTYVAVYEPSGQPVEAGGVPLRIGEGSLGDGYGIAVSAHSSTKGYVYVPDAADDTVKVYDPGSSLQVPVETIDGHETPTKGFVSLRDAAIAIDQVTGVVYVSDNLQPEYFERPEAAIYGFDDSGAYLGRLEFNIVDALPPGLAVGAGRIFVTSGNGDDALIYIYPATGSLSAAVRCAVGGACPPQTLASPEPQLPPLVPDVPAPPAQAPVAAAMDAVDSPTAAGGSGRAPHVRPGKRGKNRRAGCGRTKHCRPPRARR